MGQQQLLFLILGTCIIGIAISVGVIAVQSNSNVDYRSALHSELQQIAADARSYRARSFEDEGGEGTFIGLISTPEGMQKLSVSSLYAGKFSIVKSGNSKSVQILAVGFSPGINPRKPMKMLMTIFPESSSIAVLN